MSARAKIVWLLGVLLIAVLALVFQFVTVRDSTTRVGGYTTNAGELTAGVLVGQTFRSEQNNLSGIGVMFATYSNRNNTAPVEFHLRESLGSARDVRVAAVSAAALGDNQFHQFTFEPIPDSAGKVYFFYVVSPGSSPGNAVTVDIDSRDPYHLGTAFIARGDAVTVAAPASIAPSGKPTVDVAFETYHTVPLRTAAINAAREQWYQQRLTWDADRDAYARAGLLAIPVAMWLVAAWVIIRVVPNIGEEFATVRMTRALLGILLVAGGVFRLWYASELPVTYDEGNYLYDAWALRHGTLAGGDGYVKAPLVVLWVALWQVLAGDSILAGRLSSVVIGALTVLPIYVLARDLHSRRAGLMSAATWALLGAPVLFNIYVHTQSVALFFGISGIAVLVSTLRHATDAERRRLVFAGALLGLGVASRKSILALGLVPLVFTLIESHSWSERADRLLRIGLGFVLVIGLFVGAAWGLYGTIGIQEALGLNSAEDGITAVDPAEAEQVRAYSLRGMTPFFRESLPLILLSLLGLGFAGERAGRELIRPRVRQRQGRTVVWLLEYVAPKLTWAVPLAIFGWCAWFFFEYEGEAFMFAGMPWLWHAGWAALLTAMLWPVPTKEKYSFAINDPIDIPHSTQPQNVPPGIATRHSTANTWQRVTGPRHENVRQLITTTLLLPLWLGGLVYFYTNWIKFHANYLGEFLPPLVVMGGVGAYLTWQRILRAGALRPAAVTRVLRPLAGVLLIGLFAWSAWLTSYITYLYEHTGTFDQRAAREAAAWAAANIPADQPIFTGAALIPYLSGHRVALDIAHPRWYAYEFTRTDTERLETFLPSAEEMLAAYREATWFLHEGQTGFSFMMEYSEIEAGLERDFERVHGIENGSNTLTFYRRIRP